MRFLTGTAAFLLLIHPLAALAGKAEPTPEALEAIFSSWDREDSPGCAAGALSRGEFVFRGAWGMAHLEHAIPLTPDSVFRMASVSKQFTVAAVLRAEDLGLVSLEDPIRLHFPDLPAWAEPVRVCHLFHHTSGIRDYLVVMALAGMGDDAYYTDADVLGALRRLERLNFEPGTEYLYSNSGYWLLGRLVYRVSGRSLRDFADEHLFRPLGMEKSFFFDDYREIVPGRAAGYRPRADRAGEFELDQTTLEMVGDGGLYTSVDELGRWEQMFLDPAALGPDFVTRLTTPGRFRDGSRQDYAGGLALGSHRGLATVAHGGSFVGYRTHMLRFPQHDLAVFVLCNAANAAPAGLAMQVAEQFLGAWMEEVGEAVSAAPAAGRSTIEPMRLWEAASASTAAIRTADPTKGEEESGLFFERGGRALPLITEEGALWAMDGSVRLAITPEPGGIRVRRSGQRDFHYLRVNDYEPAPGEMVPLTGTFFCRELGVSYEVRPVLRPDGSLGLALASTDEEFPLDAVFLDTEAGAPAPVYRWSRGTIRFLPDPTGGPARGFVLSAGRARGFAFSRRLPGD